MDTNSNEWYEWSFKNEKRLMKLKSDEALLKYYIDQMNERYERWNEVYENGCSDPFSTDGCSLWLVRNHIIYYKKNIERLCELRSFPLPKDFSRPLPPEVDRNYTAKAKVKEPELKTNKLGQLMFAF